MRKTSSLNVSVKLYELAKTFFFSYVISGKDFFIQRQSSFSLTIFSLFFFRHLYKHWGNKCK